MPLVSSIINAVNAPANADANREHAASESEANREQEQWLMDDAQAHEELMFDKQYAAALGLQGQKLEAWERNEQAERDHELKVAELENETANKEMLLNFLFATHESNNQSADYNNYLNANVMSGEAPSAPGSSGSAFDFSDMFGGGSSSLFGNGGSSYSLGDSDPFDFASLSSSESSDPFGLPGFSDMGLDQDFGFDTKSDAGFGFPSSAEGSSFLPAEENAPMSKSVDIEPRGTRDLEMETPPTGPSDLAIKDPEALAQLNEVLVSLGASETDGSVGSLTESVTGWLDGVFGEGTVDSLFSTSPPASETDAPQKESKQDDSSDPLEPPASKASRSSENVVPLFDEPSVRLRPEPGNFLRSEVSESLPKTINF